MGFKDQLLSKIEKLDTATREKFTRIYKITISTGKLLIPTEMEEWATKTFGEIKDLETQTFVKIINRVTGEGAIFNELRTKRPVIKDETYGGYKEEIEQCQGDHFSTPLTATPEDVFGRIKGKYCITASNIAKYDGFHGLIIFNEHNPLNFNEEKIADYLEVARQYFKKANNVNPDAIYPLFSWNCLWKAGASVIHGHAQVVLTEGVSFARVDDLRKQVLEYENNYLANYFDDVFSVHKALGLGVEYGKTKIMAKLTPIKNNEVMIVGRDYGWELAKSINKVLSAFKNELGVASFNLVIYMPPLVKTQENWSHMPYIVRIVDRGNLSNRTADIGSMELYAQSVVESDPYYVMEALQK
ncbi:hypothetical protein L6255_01990 [Candidatus Parcubacteria bacterium]|nr:hypothetical protein [Patescibacteria group bacterium]MBU4381091.1 hypothetical protein [Patescibacteria group bacterium]MCG2689186.1 hypothetical protein [Candidatus Parcubacteria bacterium]